MAKKYTVRKFDGDDKYSWAVFRKTDVEKFGRRTVIMWGEATPVMSGMSRDEAERTSEGMNKGN